MQLPVVLDRSSPQPLNQQISVRIRELIEQGLLTPMDRLPASRELSAQLGVSRNTVAAAYQELIAQGYLVTRPVRGTYVAGEPPDLHIAEAELEAARAHRLERFGVLPLPYASRDQTGLFHAANPSLRVDFAFGRNDPAIFPEKTWRRLTAESLAGVAERMTEYGHPLGLEGLRQHLAERLRATRGMRVGAEHIVIVSGIQQGISLVAHMLVGARSQVAIEAPCYRGAAFIFEGYGAQLRDIPVDDDGMQVDLLRTQRPRLVYVTPAHQFPTGAMLALERRIALVQWAQAVGTYLLEVDYDGDYRYEGQPLPNLQALDEAGCVIYLNSFSRTIGPGLRLGYLVLPDTLVDQATRLKSLMDNGPPWLEQAILARFLESGAYDRHLRVLRHANRVRRNALMETLLALQPGTRLFGAEGGTHVMAVLPERSADAEHLSAIARRRGIGIHPLASAATWMNHHLPSHRHTLLFGYAHLGEAEIRDGLHAAFA